MASEGLSSCEDRSLPKNERLGFVSEMSLSGSLWKEKLLLKQLEAGSSTDSTPFCNVFSLSVIVLFL